MKIPLETSFNLLGDRLRLAFVRSARDEKKVGEAGVQCVELENTGILSLFIFASLRGGQNHAARFRRCHSVGSNLLTLAYFAGSLYGIPGGPIEAVGTNVFRHRRREHGFEL